MDLDTSQEFMSDFPGLEDDVISPEEQARREQEAAEQKRLAIVQGLQQRLWGEFAKRKTDRSQLELRWLRDINQYNGVYDDDTRKALESRKYGSRTFVPITRRICNIVEARLGDLLFPSDDRNFVVASSPNPDLGELESLAGRLPPDAPVNLGGGQTAVADAVKSSAAQLREEAQRKAANMQRAIDDNLKECDYAKTSRRVIHDAIKVGSGVIKGPVVFNRRKKSWEIKGNVALFQSKEDRAPQAIYVPYWNFYPDMSAATLDDSEGFFERHSLTSVKVARLAQEDGFDRNAIERILTTQVMTAQDATEAAQREASGTLGVAKDRYNIIEFNGPVSGVELAACGCEDVESSPLDIYNAVVWFSEFTGEVIKAVINPLESDDAVYSVFCWQRDGASIFGFGLPYEIRDMQDSANSSFRAAQDNMGLSVGPQLVVNSKKVVPVNGSYVVEPNKVWDLRDSTDDVKNVFGFFQVDSRLNDLLAMFKASVEMANEMGGPMLAMQGQDAPNYVQAGATGMSIAYNAASIWMRRAVRAWDDDITTPLIGRFVDWNMLFNPDPDIKGDSHVISRGTSALLEAEGQAQRLQILIKMSAELGVPIKRMVNQLRKMALAMRLEPDDVLPDDAEVKKMEEMAAKQGQKMTPEQERIEIRKLELTDNEKQRQHEATMRDQENKIRLVEIASKEELTMEQARLKYGFEAAKAQEDLADRKAERQHKAQALNAELTSRMTTGAGV